MLCLFLKSGASTIQVAYNFAEPGCRSVKPVRFKSPDRFWPGADLGRREHSYKVGEGVMLAWGEGAGEGGPRGLSARSAAP